MADHPFVPGPTSAIEKGPWHYGADYIAAYFDASPEVVQDLLPNPFVADGGRCFAYVCEIVSVSEGGTDLLAEQPDRTTYREAAIGISCRHKERKGIFYPTMWVTTEWSLLRGLLNGYQKRLADNISLTRLHPMNPGLKPMGPGTKLGGFCVKGADVKVSLTVSVEDQGSPSDLPSFGTTFGLRRFPTTDPSQGQVDEPVEILKSNSKASDVWLGSAQLRTTLAIGKVHNVTGSSYRGGFTISGSRVLR